MTPEQFKDGLLLQGIAISDKQMEQFATYFKELVAWNEKMNLTAITQQEEVYLKHFYDSITLLVHTDIIKNGNRLCDVGSGAGFPSIPLKILLPELQVVIVDSLQKRITFLQHLTQTLGLSNVTCYHQRAEAFGQNEIFRETFDVVTARAVARLNLLSELCIPLVNKQGYFISMKAASSMEEKEEASKAIRLLGGNLEEDIAFELPENAGERHILLIKKIKDTPKQYPRKVGIPAKKPIK